MVNVNKLLGILKERGQNASVLMEPLGVESVSSVYRKLADGGSKLTIREAESIGKFLKLTKKQMNDIFFAPYVA